MEDVLFHGLISFFLYFTPVPCKYTIFPISVPVNRTVLVKFVIYENDSSKEGFFCRTTVRMLKENNAVDCDLRKVGFNMLLRSRWERADSSFPVSMVPPLSLYWVSHFNQESPTLSMPEISDL